MGAVEEEARPHADCSPQADLLARIWPSARICETASERAAKEARFGGQLQRGHCLRAVEEARPLIPGSWLDLAGCLELVGKLQRRAAEQARPRADCWPRAVRSPPKMPPPAPAPGSGRLAIKTEKYILKSQRNTLLVINEIHFKDTKKYQ